VNRRGFLATLSAAIATATLDPGKLLWIPGAKKIFIPPVREASWSTATYTIGGTESSRIFVFHGGHPEDIAGVTYGGIPMIAIDEKNMPGFYRLDIPAEALK